MKNTKKCDHDFYSKDFTVKMSKIRRLINPCVIQGYCPYCNNIVTFIKGEDLKYHSDSQKGSSKDNEKTTTESLEKGGGI